MNILAVVTPQSIYHIQKTKLFYKNVNIEMHQYYMTNH